MKIKTKIRDPKVLKLAQKVLKDYIDGKTHCRKSNNGFYKVLNVGTEYRIMINNNNRVELLNHQSYNKKIDRR